MIYPVHLFINIDLFIIYTDGERFTGLGVNNLYVISTQIILRWITDIQHKTFVWHKHDRIAYTVVPALYSPRREQRPRMCGHVLIYGKYPIEIPCEKWQPTERGRGHPFQVIFPPWRSDLSGHQHQQFIASFGFTILSEMLASEIFKGIKQNQPQCTMGEFFPPFLQRHARFGMRVQKPIT